MRRFVLLALLALVALVAGCRDEPSDNAAPSRGRDTATGADATAPSADDATLAVGKGIYVARCGLCHGADGKGTSAGTPLIGVVARTGEAEVRRVIVNGKGMMPPVATLGRADAADDMDALIAYLKTLSADR